MKKETTKSSLDDPACSALPESLRNESGGDFGFVCIWRSGDKGNHAKKCTVEEWLSNPENFGGEWLIDGGWGVPPGPIKVQWDGGKWRNLGCPPWESEQNANE